MKGIVVDLNDKYAIILDKKGEFVKVKNNGNFAIGHEINIESKIIDFNMKAFSKIASTAALLVLVFGVGIGAHTYNTPCNYVNVDINPSLEFSVNVFDRVLSVNGLNNDGDKLLKDTHYKNLKIDKAVESFIEVAIEEGYLGEDTQNAVMITVSGKNEEKLSSIQEELVSAANITLEHGKVKSEILAEKVTINKHDDAKELGISPGKLLLIERLMEANPSSEVKDYKDKKVKDILAAIKEARKAAPKSDKNVEPKDGKDKIDNSNKNVNGVKDTGNKIEDIAKKDTKNKDIKEKDPQDKPIKDPKAKGPQDKPIKDPKAKGPQDKPIEDPKAKDAIEEQKKRDAIEEQRKKDAIDEQIKKDAIEEQRKKDAIEEQKKKDAIEEQIKRDAIEEQKKKDAIEEQRKKDAIEEQRKKDAIEEQKKKDAVEKDNPTPEEQKKKDTIDNGMKKDTEDLNKVKI